MRIKKYTAAAVLAIGATGITAGTAYAQPAQIQTKPAPSAPVLHGNGFTAVPAADGKSLVTTLDSGTFQLSADQKVVHVVNAAGAVEMTLPTGVQIGNQSVSLHPAIDQNGTRLTLTRVGGQQAAVQEVALKEINSQQWFFNELQHASLGALIGAIIGTFFIVGTIPGAIIGLLIAGGQPLIDSGIAYFTGQP